MLLAVAILSGLLTLVLAFFAGDRRGDSWLSVGFSGATTAALFTGWWFGW